MSKITIWGRKSSVNVQSVLWCLEELDLAYSRIDAGFTYGVVTTPAFLEMNPNGKVPVLIDGDGPAIFESGAILRYLATQYAVGPFWPDAPALRAVVDKWAEWAKINFACRFISDVFWFLVRVSPSQRDYAAITEALASIEKELAIADKVLATHAYLAGDHFSLADIQLWHSTYCYSDIDLVRADLQHVRAYWDRSPSGSAFSRYAMLSCEELRLTTGWRLRRDDEVILLTEQRDK